MKRRFSPILQRSMNLKMCTPPPAAHRIGGLVWDLLYDAFWSSGFVFETGRRGGEVARTLASHQCDPGSTPDLGSM